MKRFTVAGHSLHPMLVVFPLGLLATSLVWDVVYLASDNLMWGAIAYWTIVAGLIGGVLAAIPGLVDWLAIPDGTRAKRVGMVHAVLNVGILLLFAVSVVLRYGDGYTTPAVGSMVPGWIAIVAALPSAWLGGELVERLGVGVADFQNFNAPSSLREDKRPHRTTTTMAATGPGSSSRPV
jgi:uncharacterized membrane protein